MNLNEAGMLLLDNYWRQATESVCNVRMIITDIRLRNICPSMHAHAVFYRMYCSTYRDIEYHWGEHSGEIFAGCRQRPASIADCPKRMSPVQIIGKIYFLP